MSKKGDRDLDLIDILRQVLQNKSYTQVAKEINVSAGTVKRWLTLHSVPGSYTFELLKLSHTKIDYSKYTYKEKDQFFTPQTTAEYCYAKSIETIAKYNDNEKDYTFVEPSAGNGCFLKLMPKERRIGLDIEPGWDEIKKQDYLEWTPENLGNEARCNKYIVLGNPPFGLRGQLALKFINHSSTFAEYVCFILPQLFESDGKGVPRKRVTGLHLIHSEKINPAFETPDGKDIRVQCIFQVWSKYYKNEKYMVKSNVVGETMKIYSLSDGGTPSTTRNKKMFYSCDIYIPSTCFGKENMKYYESFETLPRRKGYGIVFLTNKDENIAKFKSIDWSTVAFLSTNSAYNIRSSQIAERFNR